MNPSLISSDMINNFKSLNRIIENVITYYFENFLSAQERSIVSKEFSQLKHENCRFDNLKYMNLKKYFMNEKRFIAFSKSMGLDKFIENTKI